MHPLLIPEDKSCAQERGIQTQTNTIIRCGNRPPLITGKDPVRDSPAKTKRTQPTVIRPPPPPHVVCCEGELTLSRAPIHIRGHPERGRARTGAQERHDVCVQPTWRSRACSSTSLSAILSTRSKYTSAKRYTDATARWSARLP